MISENLIKIQQNVASICRRVGRESKDIVLIGASKYANAQQMKEAINSGLTDIGENRVQDAVEKFQELALCGINFRRHMIGHLQSNKVKAAVEFFDMIHSVDSVKLAVEIDKNAKRMNKVMDVLVQVNTSKESQKFGVEVDGLIILLKEVELLSNLRVMGLMTMGPLQEQEQREEIRQCFHQLRECFEKVAAQWKRSDKIQMRYLSMGMSGDYDIALEEGANMIRIGRAIFL